ncbi:hypothetical protein ACTFIY_007106 [Dictyostelium cf. discoideum]
MDPESLQSLYLQIQKEKEQIEKAKNELEKKKEQAQNEIEKEKEQAQNEIEKKKEQAQNELEKEKEQFQKEKEQAQNKIEEEKEQFQKEKEQAQNEIEEEKEQMKKDKEKKSIRYLLKGITKVTETKSSSTTGHKSCEYEKKEFKCISNFNELVEKNGHKESYLLLVLNREEPISIHSESTLHHYVGCLLKDAISLCGLENELRLSHEQSIVGLKPDYWVVKKNSDFVGVIEIKRSNGVFNNRKIFGQVFDYLIGLSYLFCKTQAFCLLTTYNEAMVVFTQDSIDLAASDFNEFKDQTSKKRTRKIPQKIDNASTKNNLNTIERKLYHSERVNLGDPEKYLEFLCSVLIKMNNCSHDSRKEQTRFVVPLSMNSTEAKVQKIQLDIKTKELTDLKQLEVDRQLEEVYLLKNLGGGGDGFCWLACTSSGHSLAIKSFKKSDESLINRESQLWKEIWGIKTVVKKYLGENHLVMPFVKVVTPDDYIKKKEEFDRLVSIACQTFAEKGYQHDDLKIRHIAKYTNQENETKYIFIDLTRVLDIKKTKEAIDASKEKMKNDIEKDYDNETSNHYTQIPTPPDESLNKRFCNPFIVQETPVKK